MQTADVVIIGGGIVGSSIAFHLTEAGCRNLLIVERETAQGKGSTGKSMGGVRAQFSTRVNIQMSLYSIPFYAEFEERFSQPTGYRAQGYLFLATKPSHVEYLDTNYALQKRSGLTTVRQMTTDEIAHLYPQLKLDDVLGANFCATDGFVDPYSAMNSFMEVAKQRGATLWKDAEVSAIEVKSGGFTVRTKKGDIDTPTVVNAAGAWSAAVAKMVGLDLPVEPLRRMLVPTEPFDEFPHSAPMIIDMGTGFHFRPEGRGFLLAWNDADETPGYKLDFEPSFIEKILVHAADLVPCFERVAVNPKRAWAGLYEMTPDHHPVIGAAKAVPGFLIASGFSGHGVMHAPATGKIVSDLILNGKTDVVEDASVFELERFAEGRLLHETAVL